uniref:Uncharacterized protein n=1 Tax=Chromera velia CCMP2878 TaxID=1169474 RepID=A0A0G4FQ01_9ALVE|eukprot:Cvel_17978.t1-p1 / transcript=Cvel_17978.t1 / gene=Cvel_17978 / organism=Chromera_velia_CCMP2878 / gene_product=hypothetical protein / transcript_product=hypothetical protein / location=Cvel_scaffold1464:8800-9456(+) / protein_length=162 / sequence_SO=supercontig / SO=protein_coding / is_pseudo=false
MAALQAHGETKGVFLYLNAAGGPVQADPDTLEVFAGHEGGSSKSRATPSNVSTIGFGDLQGSSGSPPKDKGKVQNRTRRGYLKEGSRQLGTQGDAEFPYSWSLPDRARIVAIGFQLLRKRTGLISIIEATRESTLIELSVHHNALSLLSSHLMASRQKVKRG